MRVEDNKKKPVRKPVQGLKKPMPASEQDPLGSYTGRPLDGGLPVQDADDL